MFSLLIFLKIILLCSNNINDKLIISLTSNQKNIINAEIVINSILEQNVDNSLYQIILILSKYDFKNKNDLSNKLLSLEKSNELRIILIEDNINSQTKLIIAMKEYQNNPILIINDNIIFPDGWLEMFINDHNKYPNDTISASIQYFFGYNLIINEFSEGYKGQKFGIFNHVTNMIFNFALINTNLGGTLYPQNYFKDNKFFDSDLFLKLTNDSDEFWQSCFIMIENKTLRQSSKIYDYTKYIINDSNTNKEKKIIFEKIKLSFFEYFPEFKNIIENRQQKIIVSFTSYPKRFHIIPTVLKSLNEQTFHINKIILILSEEDKKYYNLNITQIDIITINKDLRPHNKYYYTMQKYRDYAIITIDDDTYYAKDTFESLYKSYLENPNIVSGRRSHFMTYKKNGELKKYQNWIFEQRKNNEIDFNIFLTGVGCIIYPPDILIINEKYLPFIHETITNDDITLKYFAIQRGIPHKWVVNYFINGIPGLIAKNQGNPLVNKNFFDYNDKYIKIINIDINHIILNNLCVPYKDVKTGLTIFLYNIHNITINNRITHFNIYAYSYCPLDILTKFNIYFNTFEANCNFMNITNITTNNRYRQIASCFINDSIIDLNNCLFPKAISENKIHIKISNYRKYLNIIFNDFYCINTSSCILNALFYQNLTKDYILEIKINDNNYICKLEDEIIYLNNIFPIIKNLYCEKSYKQISKYNYVSGLPTKFWNSKNNNINITNLFIISRIVTENNQVIIIGKFYDNLEKNLKNLSINFYYPEMTLTCSISSISKYAQAHIYCMNNEEINSEILIENQIVYSDSYKFLLINEEALIIRNNLMNINVEKDKKSEYIKLFLYFVILLFIIIIKISFPFINKTKLNSYSYKKLRKRKQKSRKKYRLLNKKLYLK